MDNDATVQLNPPTKKLKVLLVEDEANIASMVQDWLSEKYDVVIASTGKAALEKAVSEKPAIILEDINLPDMTGFDVVKVLEKDSKTNQVPVIFLTGEKMVEETVKFISTVKNVKGYVNKPFRLKDFLEKIDQILSKKSEFVVLENRTSAPPNAEKAELVREARAKSGKEEEKRPVIPVPRTSGASFSGGERRGFFRSLVSVTFRTGLWFLWTLLAVAAGAELACRAAESFTGGWTFLPPRAPGGGLAAPGASLPGAVWEQNGVTYRINVLGLRDREPPAPSTGTFRAVVLGGSALFGRDVPLSETFSKRLAGLLDQSGVFVSSGAGRHDVVHGALWGLSPADQWTAYESLHPRLKPDLVIWVLGDPKVRRPSQRRLKDMEAVPLPVRPWLELSRVAGLLETLYAYTPVPGEAAAILPLTERVNKFLETSTGTALMVLSLDKEEPLTGLVARANVLSFDVSKIVGLDNSWKGLTPRGHEDPARAAFPLLQRYSDRIKPRPVAQVPVPPLVPPAGRARPPRK